MNIQKYKEEKNIIRKQRNDILRGYRKPKRKKWGELSRSQKNQENCSVRLRKYLFKNIYSISSKNIFGISPDGYKKYLQSKFKDGMTWYNYGKIWCIDHIKPSSSFDLENYRELCKCFNYKNSQPLFISENSSKLNKNNNTINIFSMDITLKFKEQKFTQQQIDFIAYYLPALYTIKEIHQSLIKQKK